MPMELSSFILTWMTSGVTPSWLNIWKHGLSQEKLSVLSSMIFYARCQKPKETEDQFADELQVLARKFISVCPWMEVPSEWGTENPVCPIGCKTNILQLWPTICWKWHHLTQHSQSSRQNVYLYSGPGQERQWRLLCPPVQLKIIQVKLTSHGSQVTNSAGKRKKRRSRPRLKWKSGRRRKLRIWRPQVCSWTQKNYRGHDTGHGLYVQYPKGSQSKIDCQHKTYRR